MCAVAAFSNRGLKSGAGDINCFKRSSIGSDFILRSLYGFAAARSYVKAAHCFDLSMETCIISNSYF